MTDPYAPLLPVFVVALLAVLVAGLLPRSARVPQVVLLLVGGVAIGPHGWGLSSPEEVVTLSDLGLGFLFLLAGYELEPAALRDRVGRLSGAAWGTSFLFALALVGAVTGTGLQEGALAGAIALTTTALGVVLPILKDAGQLKGPLGRVALAVGAFGELGPIVAMAVLLGARRGGVTAVLLALFALAIAALAVLPSRIRLPVTGRLLRVAEHGTAQSTVRLTMVLLTGLLAATVALGFDAVLGAFLGGMVLRQWAPGDVERLEGKLEVVAWGVFVPVFFVSSGMGLDVTAMVREPWLPILLWLLLLVVRGGPLIVLFQRELGRVDRARTALYGATTLPLLVALTELAVNDGAMTDRVATALVGAGLLSVVINPLVAGVLGGRSPRPAA
ncbi:cation:proton antiporter [Cellulomonas soli]|uniref:Potassium transporter Kef n=1 Tax=Cellulomonas soli TaxID=931535 RepID=A0A512PCU1_9CELL|nr:cation:proton antiporter [Cellulomonas soli]NYI58552.1 Kef-type K+ transport system membrane component KefB [Cellulomonas soli]GEP68976.1 potassium transporter Kef [Cellulomonas soli]